MDRIGQVAPVFVNSSKPWWLTHDPFKNPSPVKQVGNGGSLDYLTADDMEWIRNNMDAIGYFFKNEPSNNLPMVSLKFLITMSLYIIY